MNYATEHRGAFAPGPLNQAGDPRVSQLDLVLRQLSAITPALTGQAFLSDPLRSAGSSRDQLGQDPLVLGMVVHAFPHLGWYKVQLGQMQGIVGCCMVSAGGLVPVGPRDSSVVPPGSLVLVYKPRGLNYGIILGVLPPILTDGRVVNPDWITQGAPTGYKREPGHTYPLKNLVQAGGIIDFSAQKPVDGTSLERGILSMTGIGLIVSDYEAFLRVNEACGLFLNYYDSYCRLAGVQMDISSAIHETSCRDDEGESRFIEGIAAYPWESLGLYVPGQDIVEEYDDKVVQYTGNVAKLDQPTGEPDIQPIYRWTEYGGYLGQGHLRSLMRPAKTEGKRLYRDTDPDEGLFCESVAMNGAYMVSSAKSLLLTKRVKIIIPKEIAPPEDGQTGDDARKDNYKFSSQFGNAEEHKLNEIGVEGENAALRRIAAIDDDIAFEANWQALHPFHYHTGDFHTAQESEQNQFFSRTQTALDFSSLQTSAYLPDPQAKVVPIDHRLTDARYVELASHIAMTEDGGILIGDGYGATIKLCGGRVRIEAPGGIDICPGTDLIMLASQIILRAKQSIDLSATEHDIRLKGKNIQVLAGNGETGGILLESKSTSTFQQYTSRTGEDVVSNGIVLRAAKSLVTTLAGQIYLRTGGADLNTGDIVLDSGKGEGSIHLYGKSINAYSSENIAFFMGPTDETSDVAQTYFFGKDSCLITPQIILGGSLICYPPPNGETSIIIDGNIYATGDIAAAGNMADQNGFFLGQVPPQFGSAISQGTSLAAQDASTVVTAGKQLHAAAIVQQLYQSGQIGNDNTVSSLMFSFRDSQSSDQYHVGNLVWPERRWEQMSRLGTGSGGVTWTEDPVEYQGLMTYPWPGEKKWKTDDTVFLRLKNYTMFDPQTGYNKDRPDPYVNPKLADWDPATMEDGYRLIR